MKVFLVFSDKFITRFMQDADMFEPFKVFIKPLLEADVIDGWGEKNIKAIQRISAEEGKYELVAAIGEEFVWTDPKVKAISFGDSWAMLDDYIEFLQMRLRGKKWEVGLGVVTA